MSTRVATRSIATIADGVSIELALPQGNDVRSAVMAEIEMLAREGASVLWSIRREGRRAAEA